MSTITSKQFFVIYRLVHRIFTFTELVALTSLLIFQRIFHTSKKFDPVRNKTGCIEITTYHKMVCIFGWNPVLIELDKKISENELAVDYHVVSSCQQFACNPLYQVPRCQCSVPQWNTNLLRTTDASPCLDGQRESNRCLFLET